MLADVILGLLEVGVEGTAFALAKEYNYRAISPINEGNLRTTLSKLAHDGLVTVLEAPPGRPKKPHRITDTGRQQFRHWVCSPETVSTEWDSWVLFLPAVPSATLDTLLENEKSRLLQHCKVLSHQCEDHEAHFRLNGSRYDAKATLTAAALKHTIARVQSAEDLQEHVKTLRGIGLLER